MCKCVVCVVFCCLFAVLWGVVCFGRLISYCYLLVLVGVVRCVLGVGVSIGGFGFYCYC